MNQELTQRIIGAIVVTALAAIFIPMLFEDPVDNSGQVVSELVIPEEPAFTVDDSASKLPRNAEEIEALPDETVETPDKSNGTAFTDMENPPPPPSEEDEAEGMDPDAPADEGSPPDADMGSTPPSSQPAASLDTGEVKEVPPPVVKIPSAVSSRISKPEAIKPPKKAPFPAVKPTVTSKPTPVPVVPQTPTPVPSKPAKTAGNLSRFYIQAGSFSKKDNAQSLADTIRKQGMPVLLETIQTSKGTMYRLRVGPELDKKRAVAMKSKLDQQNIKGILVAE